MHVLLTIGLWAASDIVVVFAGYGGHILRSPHFQSNRKYLHMHPGDLPSERGSTTMYYSILNGRDCTVTSFYMTEKIDDGRTILKETYPVPVAGVDIDRWFDNAVRADCFGKAIEKIVFDRAEFVSASGEDHEYYVIHPLLKHLALLGLSK